MTAEWVVFAGGLAGLRVFVALVGRDKDSGAVSAERAEGFEDVDGTCDVGGVGFEGLSV